MRSDMKGLNVLALVVVAAGFVKAAQGQITPEISKKLHSTDWVDRQGAYSLLTSEKNQSAEVKTALVDLLLREDQVLYEANRLGKLEDYGEGYGSYLGRLGDTVFLIAQKEPGRVDVWPALLRLGGNPESVLATW